NPRRPDRPAPARWHRPPRARSRPAPIGRVRSSRAGRRAPAPRYPERDRSPGSRAMNAVLGWDIGGVNTKGARVAQARVVATGAVPYELQRDPAALTPLLRRLACDVGATTTDIVPIAGGVSRAAGVNDTERLREGELVYTGALRTPTEAIAATVPVCDRPTSVSAEGLALAGDVHLSRGELAPEDYS